MYEWNDEYCIGVDKIDAQHQKLFKIVARIEDIFSDDDFERSQRAIIEAIKYLKDYTIEHFSAEEEFQLKNEYSKYKVHKLQHEGFKLTIAEYEKKMLEADYSESSVESFLDMLKKWLVNHIMNSDKAIAKEIWAKKEGEE